MLCTPFRPTGHLDSRPEIAPQKLQHTKFADWLMPPLVRIANYDTDAEVRVEAVNKLKCLGSHLG